MGFLPLQSVSRLPWGRLPVPFPPALYPPPLGETGRAALQGLAGRPGRSNPRGTTNSLEVLHQDLSSASPDDSVPVGYPTGSESACLADRPGSGDPRPPDLPKGPDLPKETGGPRSPGHRRRSEDRRTRSEGATRVQIPGPVPVKPSPQVRRPEDRAPKDRTGDGRSTGSDPEDRHPRPEDRRIRRSGTSPETAGRSSGSTRPKHRRRSEDRRVRPGGHHRRPDTHPPDGSPRQAPRPGGVASPGTRLGSGGCPPKGLALTPHCQREAFRRAGPFGAVSGFRPSPTVDEVGKTGPVRPSRAWGSSRLGRTSPPFPRPSWGFPDLRSLPGPS
jgi:hypothetical protein